MKQEVMEIIQQNQLAPRIFELTLKGELVQEMKRPGQFIHIRVPRADLLLRRPTSLNKIDPSTNTCRIIYRVEGDGTKSFSTLTTGDTLDVMGPLGNGFDLTGLKAGDCAFIVGGGIGIPPLYELSHQLKAKGVKVKHFLGFASADVMYYEEKFQQLGETKIATDDGSAGVQGNVGNLLLAEENKKPDAVFACGANGMLKAVEHFFHDHPNVQLSLESRMACGIGACYACVCHKAEDETKSVKVCDEGPIFKAGEVIL
ncbi:dihydroorotate dehydrogenase electron transfer subunit [Enterococcus thailandicus]|uniref:Dihydroorotate dehydrogenase B (NAD(+)), electron transfer subunit n=1 Tax=bioreactor metagenome TaxID=1076179 RepID=A0A645CIK1_9ZZZZ|nr:dihydroorotate dehydrogenase electron transfer subunit [Enterococcus thailandicus]MDK4350980.1 dihydroorotate dehydrogenase electron transfer subunit [Enterococcus thailandicus]MDT2733366.1 dihydroorotate dehydrogenase electron transfer subunit [Enterococcus thailandicus]